MSRRKTRKRFSLERQCATNPWRWVAVMDSDDPVEMWEQAILMRMPRRLRIKDSQKPRVLRVSSIAYAHQVKSWKCGG